MNWMQDGMGDSKKIEQSWEVGHTDFAGKMHHDCHKMRFLL